VREAGNAEVTAVWVRLLPIVLVLVNAACAPSAPAVAPAPQGETAPRADVQRTLIIVGGRAPDSLSSKPLREERPAARPPATMRTFNAGLAINDERDVPRPYLAEALPQLNSESWRVSA